MRIIINADDLGYSMETNQEIFSLMDNRGITSSTLLANAPAFDDAVKRIPDYRGFSFGVHLNLTEFASMTRAQVFYDAGLIDRTGAFRGEFRPKAGPSQALKDAVLREWEEQVGKILDNGVRISHLDSHHHTHTQPWLFLPLKRLQKKFGIKRVRGTVNWYNVKEYRPPVRLLLRKKAWQWALRNYYTTKTTEYFTPFSWFMTHLQERGKGLRGTVELMCHPGHPYFPGQRYSLTEKKLLGTDWTRQLPRGMKLISYNQL